MATQNLNKDMSISTALKNQATVLNTELLKASNELVDSSVKSIEKWQDLGEKVLKTGVKMFAIQQEVTFATLETLKNQFIANRKRFNKLVGNTPKKAETKIESDLTIDELMDATVKPKKAVAKK
jgi:hypothetical protein